MAAEGAAENGEEKEDDTRPLSKVVLKDFPDAITIRSRPNDEPSRGSRSGLPPRDLLQGLISSEPLKPTYVEVEALVKSSEEAAALVESDQRQPTQYSDAASEASSRGEQLVR